jgi:hypothetical protein
MTYTITFAGVSITVVQAGDLAYTQGSQETLLYSGLTHAALSPIVSTFPRSYNCYTTSSTVFDGLYALMAAKTFGNLVVNGTTYPNCWISNLSSIFEIKLGSGKYTYKLEFKQAGVY